MSKIKDNGLVDLHVHTIFSDGILSPEAIINKAIERDLKAIAITDHDCVDGILSDPRLGAGVLG